MEVADPSWFADSTVEQPRCEGDHFFENICNDCDSAQPDGPCSVCPHVQTSSSSEHFARRPCRSCGSPNLRTVRVRAPRTP